MKRSYLFSFAVLFALLCAVFYACRKEIREVPADAALSIRQAKQFFEADIVQKNRQTIERHGISRKFLPKQNKWDHAFHKQLSGGEAVVVPLRFSTELYMKRDGGRVHLPLSDLSWMLFYRDSLNKIHGEVVTYLPDDAYFRKGNKNKKFSGQEIPYPQGYWTENSGGSNPGYFGQDVGKMTNTPTMKISKFDEYKKAPKGKGPCK